MGGRRCAHPGCGRFVKQDAIWCGRHGDAARRDLAERTAPARDGGVDAAGIEERLARAAADPGLDEEIGAVRVTLLRLLRDEDVDPLKLALAVARLAAVAVQAAKARQTLADTSANPWQALVKQAAALADEAGAAGGTGDAGSAGDAGRDDGRAGGGSRAGVDLRGGDAADGGRAAG
ncbi:MAG TPA: hypothetical protein VFU81_05645 [Thermomicrobiales bacterium]|nr:hypothetical protein [Thermomicrobiales bacterium]